MTPAQRHLYWRAWHAAAKARGWVRVDSLRSQRPPAEGPDAATNLLHDIWDIALRRAAGRPLTPDHMRHAVHQLVLGQDKSHLALTDRELDLVLACFRLLVDETDLRAAETLRAWAGDHTTRRRKWWLRHAVRPEYLSRIMHDFFGHDSLERLNARDVATLHAIVKRRIARGTPAPAHVH